MRVLALVTHGFGGYGGIAQYNRDLTSALASMESVESIEILPRIGQKEDEEAHSSKIHQERGAQNRALYSVRALLLALRYRPELIFCGHLYMAPLAYALASLLRKPFWLQLHGLEAWRMPSRRIRYAAERANLITAVSRYTRRRFLAWANVTPEIVKVLPNTFDFPPPDAASKDHHKERCGLAGRKVMLTVSRLDQGDRYKGHDKVLTVLPTLLRSHADLMYVIVGDGDDRACLERIAQQLSVSDAVRFAGRISREELHDYYRLADVFVMPSIKEGFGIVFLEAASFGLPVIGGNADGSVDALAEGGIGAAIDPQSLNSLVDAIDAVLCASPRPVQGPKRFSRDQFSFHLEALVSGTS